MGIFDHSTRKTFFNFFYGRRKYIANAAQEKRRKMGRSIYLTEKEMQALRDSATEWCEMMGNGDEEANKCVEERMENGLGSAMRKLYKGCNAERIYQDY